jgi:uncharacterized membrane protein
MRPTSSLSSATVVAVIVLRATSAELLRVRRGVGFSEFEAMSVPAGWRITGNRKLRFHADDVVPKSCVLYQTRPRSGS